MAKNQLSKSERKYRSKIIAEEHLDKYWQRVLDEYMGWRVTRFLGVTYKKCYFDKTSILTAVRAEQQLRNVSDMLSTSVGDAADNFKSPGEVVSKIADAYVKMGNVYPLFIDEE